MNRPTVRSLICLTAFTILGAGVAAAQTNTAFGNGALPGNTGSYNSAFGFDALFSNSTGGDDNAVGAQALFSNSSGSFNSAIGVNALYSNTTGSDNTAAGHAALALNSTGDANTAVGEFALFSNSTGSRNSAFGVEALMSNRGHDNTASGFEVLDHNSTGTDNSAVGSEALFQNTTGSFNTASGVSALGSNTTGQKNVALGLKALFNNTSGQSNTAVGYGAGINLTTGSSNIEIGNGGAAADSKIIRIGTQGTQVGTFIAGIRGSAVTGADVVVNGAGKLGVVASSARYKKDIKDMGASTDSLMKLRPVTFKYRNDKQGITQYGLVAEEAEKVYPELVTYDADGKVETVRYSMLTAMLLNELQKQRRENQQMRVRLARVESEIARMEQRMPPGPETTQISQRRDF